MLPRIFFAALFFCFTTVGLAQQKRFSFSAPKMGSPFNIVLYSDDSTNAGVLATQCFSLVDSFVNIFSDYLPESELSRLSASAGSGSLVKVSPAMYDILLLSKTAWKKTGGAFDITIGPIVRLWRKARKTKQFPPDDSVKAMCGLIGFKNIMIDTINREVKLLKKGMQLDLGGIAQGYIAQKLIEFLNRRGVSSAMINCSGDIVMSDAPPGGRGWVIGINAPGMMDELLPRTLLLHNKAVTTSGDAYQFMEKDGKRYSHIIDPGTGYGVTFQRNVTVIAANGTSADWLATACSILPVKQAKKLAGEMGAELLITETIEGEIKYYSTRGFANYWKPREE